MRVTPQGLIEEHARLRPSGSDTAGPRTAPHRFHELDLLRLVAALAVVAFHYTFRASVSHPVLAETGFHDPHGIFRYGYLGVDLFFVISGFVILNSSWNKPASSFVASRVARLYPAFWVACTITALVIVFDPNGRFDVSFGQWLVNLTMAPDLFNVNQVDGVYWTLLIELKFYALILVLCVIRMTRIRVLAFAIGWLAVSIWHSLVPLPSLLAQLLIPDWSAYFIAGILFALIAREGWQPRYTAPLAIAYVWCLHLAAQFADGQSRSYGGDLRTGTVTAIVTAIFAVFALIASHKLRARWTAKVAFLGALTYPVYLLHQNVGFVLFNLGNGRVGKWTLAALVLGTVLGLSWALHVLVERRFGPPLSRWVRRRLTAIRDALAGVRPMDEIRHSDLPLASTAAKQFAETGSR
jgi:peptidoglycan/LPS O-acetylase OafA/YrhL